jgi:tRNA A-37 threonylcarbamoyl transferase component Bud32
VEFETMTIIKDHPLSRLWQDGDWMYKWQPKFLTDNEIWCLLKLRPSGYVPEAQRLGPETIRLELIHGALITDPAAFMAHLCPALEALKAAGIRHGDLTRPNVLVRDNRPFLIDFAESRLWDDPRPDKRPDANDYYYLEKTMEDYCAASQQAR